MGILNITPDSFYDGGQYFHAPEAALQQAEEMIREGASILDIGGASSRPGAHAVSAAEETDRVLPVIETLIRYFPDALISIDTWQSAVAKAAVKAGAAIVNDISGGRLDPAMPETVAALNRQYGGIPYILMHMQGTPANMQQHPTYEDVVTEVLDYFIERLHFFRSLGLTDIVLDPGFGFGKTLEHNYELLRNLHVFEPVCHAPLLAGISRKSMVCKVLNLHPKDALNGSTALHMLALQQGAHLLRVHDVKEAMQTVRLWNHYAGRTN